MTEPRLVGERYELGELVGYGGMAEVHRGYDTRLNREVAIKVLRSDLARDPSFLNRFRREAHSAAGLNHPAVVSVYDTGEDVGPDGTAVPFIVMEYVQGRTLRDILKSEGRLPARRAMEITADVCNALDFSHRNGIIHRDIKPANVMITPSGAVKVMDFGIARALADGAATQTQTANVIGTAQYLSPEQARGEPVDARSDVYSTGCLLYELVTGMPPFQGDSPVAIAYQHVRENPVSPSARNPDLPRAVDSVVMKALAKNQLNRYQSAGDMRADIQRALANEPVTAEAVMTDAERTQFISRSPVAPVVSATAVPYDVGDDDDSGRRSGLIWAAVVVALLLVIGLGGYFLTKLGSDKKNVAMIAVPSVIGETPSQAAADLKRQGFVPTAGNPTDGVCTGQPTVHDGLVCTTSPAVGVKIDKGATVVYHVYETKKVNIPSVTGKSASDAVNTLENNNLHAKEHMVNNSAPAGTVIRQKPKAYSQKVPLGYTIQLYVSTGKVKLPDVIGKKLDVAEQVLAGAGFPEVSIGDPVTTANLAKDGRVAQQNPPSGLWAVSVQVTLKVYKYVAPPTSCPPSTPPPSETIGPPSGSTGATTAPPSTGLSLPTSSAPSGTSTC